MPDGKNTVTKPPVPKAPAALSKASNQNDELNRRSFFSWLSCLLYTSDAADE